MSGPSDQDNIKAAEKGKTFQEEAASLQTSMLDRLGAIYDVLLNQIYNVMNDIWETVSNIFSWLKFGRDRKGEFNRAQSGANRSGDIGLQAAFAGLNPDDTKSLTEAKNSAIEQVTARALQSMSNATAEAADIKAKLAKEEDPRKRTGFENRLTELKPALDEAAKYQGKSLSEVKDILYNIAKRDDLGGVPEVIRLLSMWLKGGKNSPMAQAVVAVVGDEKFAGDKSDELFGEQQNKTPQEVAAAAEALAKAGETVAAPPAPGAMTGENAPRDAGAESGLIGGNVGNPTGFASAAGLASTTAANGTPTNITVGVELRMSPDAKRFVTATAQDVTTKHDTNRRKG